MEKTAEDMAKLFPNDYKYGFGVPNYESLVASFEYEILEEYSDDDYQGDSYYLLQDGRRIGYLRFGWGSCSGCDALQGCNNYADLAELYNQLHEDIRWEPDPKSMLAWFKGHDWKGEYRKPEVFVKDVIAKLETM